MRDDFSWDFVSRARPVSRRRLLVTLSKADDTLRPLEVKRFAVPDSDGVESTVLRAGMRLFYAASKIQGDMAVQFPKDAKPLVSRMKRGPTCVFLPDSTAPAVSVQAWFPVGSITETDPVEGISHFLEHMIFKGSQNLEVGELASLAESSGGDINAYTTIESTYYDLISTPDAFEACLEALLDALWRPRFDENEIRQEKQVILSELNRAYEQPDQLLQYHLHREAYGRRHPYGRAVLGTRRTVKGIHARELRKYHEKFYSPSSAILVFAGAFDVRRIKSILRKKQKNLIAEWPEPRREKSRKIPDQAPPRAGPRVLVRRGRSGPAHLDLAFGIPPLTHRDAPALEVLAMVLGAGASSRLYERLCMDEPLMFDVSADACFCGGPGLFFMGGCAAPENAEKAVERVVRVAKRIIEDAPATLDELEKARMNYRADMEFRRESMRGRARVAGYSALITGDADYYLKYMERVMAVEAKEVSDAARRYLTPPRLTVGALFPKGERAGIGARKIRKAITSGFEGDSEGTGGDARRNRGGSAKPAASVRSRLASGSNGFFENSRRAETRDKPIRRKLPGGGRLVMLPGGAPSVFSLRAVFPGGQRSEPSRRGGLHALMMSVAPLATGSRPSFIHTKEVEGLGAAIDGFAGKNTFGLTAAGLSAALPEIMEKFAEIVSDPAFDEDDVEFAKAELDAERDSELDDPGQYCRFKGYRLLYGSHPLGRHPLGTPRTMAALNRSVLRREWRRRVSPANLIIAVAGNFDVSYLARRLPGMLAPWARSAPRETPVLQPAPPRNPLRRRFRSYAFEGASQSHIHMSFLGATFREPARHALSVLAAVLGSQGGGLFWELREKRGLAYDVSVSSQESLDPGPISIYAATLPGAEKLAIDLMREEIARLSRTGPGDEELRRAKSYLVGGLSRSHQRSAARVADLAFGLAYGLRWKTLEEATGRIERVDGNSVREAARRFMSPNRECLVTVSDSSPK